ncbi:MAG: ATP-binding protein [Prosthecobacter sp.]|uniref:ATP-binding protein n=1 Tax=Prosthecobacter sp. TaxID=1965333 RepID=UPI003903F8C6
MKSNTRTALFAPELSMAPTSGWSSVTTVMRRQPAWLALVLPLLLALLMGWLDYDTGWEVSLFIFYALPIFLAVWWSGSRAGLLIALLSGVVWWFANKSTHPYDTQMGYAWALVNRVFYFCVVVFAVTAVRSRQEADAARIQMLEERRQLEQDIVSVSEYEQQRIGQDLHDGLCQQLAAIGCAARLLAEELQALAVPAVRDAVMIEASIQQAVLEARNLARGIFPVHVDRSGLAAALADLARMTSQLTGVAIEVKEGIEAQLDNPEASMHLYRIAQEAVANAVRHSSARQIVISLQLTGSELELRVEDDGTGMTDRSPDAGEGMGLRTMRYRAQALGAVLEIKPRAGGGTTVRCRLPVQTQLEEAHTHG